MLRHAVLLAFVAASAVGDHHMEDGNGPRPMMPLVGPKERQKLRYFIKHILLIIQINQIKSRYHIENLYDGSPIDHPASPAVIEISLTCHGELKLDVSAPFYYRYSSHRLICHASAQRNSDFYG